MKGVDPAVKNTFRGGVHPEGHKDLSRECRLRPFNPKGEMVFPLSMHIGKPAKPVVQKNDEIPSLTPMTSMKITRTK